MGQDADKPIVQKYNDREWEFIYPASLDNEKINNELWNAIELLDDDDAKAEVAFKKLISKHPFFLDAYNHLSLAFRNQGKEFESLLTAEKSYNLGRSCFPKSFNLKKDKLIWANLDNRPFLRACQIYGLECQYHNKHDEAAEVYALNLELCENDNQGIRYLLLETYFATKDFNGVRQLLDKHPDDFSIEFKFGAVALNILMDNYEQADKDLIDAVETNKFFIDEVIKDKHIKPTAFKLSGGHDYEAGLVIGYTQQAFDYWTRNEQLYKTKKIIDYFKTKRKPFSNN